MKLEKINGKTRIEDSVRITPRFSAEGHIIEAHEYHNGEARTWICEDFGIVAFTINEMCEKLSEKLGK